MNRLRVRVELNRRRAGVPMHELVSVVEETHKFFQLLGEDVNIDSGRGEWHASNFDPESLNFTAEFDGPATPDQISAFGSSFAGATSLRRETIAQFTRIADFIGEDELVGFGLYQSDQENEPSDWRCLSRQDAMRFADEIRLLARAGGGSEEEAPLPAVMNGAVGGRRLFKDRREREALAADPGRYIREVESSLSRRIALLEGKFEVLDLSPEAADERFQKMLAAMEVHQNHAPQPEPPQPLMLSAPEPAGPIIATLPPQARGSRLAWGIGMMLAGAVLAWAAMHLNPLSLDRQMQPAEKVLNLPAPRLPEAALLVPPVTIAEPESSPAPREAAAEIEQQFALEIPEDLRPLVRSDVLVTVIASIDRNGKVATADVLSTKGDGAEVLIPEALRAARRFRFRPARLGKTTVPSKTMLSFTFNPD